MNKEDIFYFSQLRKAVSATFLRQNQASPSIEEWKGSEITLFQEDLFETVKARVSEKWFYTYFKNTPEKLPRIDMLNMLSQYVGFDNWNAFKSAQNNATKINKPRKSYKTLFALLGLIPLIIIFSFMWTSENEFQFCFIDAVKNEAIRKIPLDIKILQDNESPLYFKSDSMGCFSYKTKNKRLTFVVQSPYHKTDTIIRNIDSESNQIVKLTTDDYALMLHYYTSGNVKDWKQHKSKLHDLIATDAQIYQLFENSIAVELFSKDDFIRFLTIPTNSLNHIKILDKTMANGQIVKLKFSVK